MLALVYDVHGNATALSAVLDDIAARGGADEFLLGGDYCMLGAEPLRCLELLEAVAQPKHWIRGNTERWVADPAAAGDIPVEPVRDACFAALEAVGAERATRLNELPIVFPDLRDGVIFCHASPESDMAGFFEQPADHETGLLAGLERRTVVCGHTHQQFDRRAGETRIVNPGSVGMPFDEETAAAYAVLHDDGTIELRRTAYDVEQAIAAYGDMAGDWVELAKRRLRTARP